MEVFSSPNGNIFLPLELHSLASIKWKIFSPFSAFAWQRKPTVPFHGRHIPSRRTQTDARCPHGTASEVRRLIIGIWLTCAEQNSWHLA